jgi:hypothetical protein
MILALFVIKRICFVVGVWFIKTELCLIIIEITLANMCLIIFAKPYLEDRMYRIELFNEMVAMIFFTFLQAYRGEMLNPEEQNVIGWCSTAIIIAFITVHLTNNFIPYVSKCI